MRIVQIEASLESLFANTDIVYGCTGTDIGNAALKAKRRGQLLVSLSSGDIEFASVLKKKRQQQHTIDRPFMWAPVYRSDTTIAHGGLPITFDGAASSAPLIEMQLPRALLLSGLQQAANSNGKAKGGVALGLDDQWQIAQKWKNIAYSSPWDPATVLGKWVTNRNAEFGSEDAIPNSPAIILDVEILRTVNEQLFADARKRATGSK